MGPNASRGWSSVLDRFGALSAISAVELTNSCSSSFTVACWSLVTGCEQSSVAGVEMETRKASLDCMTDAVCAACGTGAEKAAGVAVVTGTVAVVDGTLDGQRNPSFRARLAVKKFFQELNSGGSVLSLSD